MHVFAFAAFVKAQRDGRAAVADMLRTANFLRPVDVTQCDIIGRREILRRESIQRANINVTHGVTFAGTHGGQVAGGDNRQGEIATQRAGGLVLLLVIVGDGTQ